METEFLIWVTVIRFNLNQDVIENDCTSMILYTFSCTIGK